MGQQLPQAGEPTLIQTPSGVVELYADGTMRVRGGGAPTAPGLPVPTPDASRLSGVENIPPREVASGIVRGLGIGAGLLPIAGQAGMAARIAFPSIASGAANLMEGGSLEDAGNEAAFDAALGVGGEAIPPVARGIGNWLGMALGMVPKKMWGPGIKSYSALQAQNPIRPPIVGLSNMPAMRVPKTGVDLNFSVNDQLARGRSALEKAESASPMTTRGRDLRTQPPQGPADLPISREEKFNEYQEAVISEQVMEKLGMSRQQWMALPWVQRRRLINQTLFSTREVGEIQRPVATKAAKAREAAQAGTPQYEVGFTPEAANEIVTHLRDLRHGPGDVGTPQSLPKRLFGAAPKPGETGAIKAADARLAQLYPIREVEDAIKQGTVAGTGPIGGRMAIGSMLGRMLGVDWTTGALLGPILLAPSAPSAAGHIAATGIKPLIATERATRRKKARQREP